MRTYGFEIILFGWLAYNIFVEIHDWVTESIEDEQTIVAPEPIKKGEVPNVK